VIRSEKRNTGSGFTLVELLVVLFIVGLISAATLPVIIPTLNQRQVQEGSRIIQQAILNARFAAMSTGRPAGIRLLPDPVFNGPDANDPFRPLAYNRIIQLEPAPDYSDGMLRVASKGATETEIGAFFAICAQNNLSWKDLLVGQPPNASRVGYPPNAVSHGNQDVFLNMMRPAFGNNPPVYQDPRIVLRQYKAITPTEPTSWAWNIRAGDRISVGVQNKIQYVIAGPTAPFTPPGGYNKLDYNPERFINLGLPAAMVSGFQLPMTAQIPQFPLIYNSEILYVVAEGNRMFDGVDNNNDGVIDPAFDAIDNDGNGYIDDPGEVFFAMNGSTLIDPVRDVVAPLLLLKSSPATILQSLRTVFEWEPATIGNGVPDPATGTSVPQEYTIRRRMVPSANAAEVGLPSDVVIDATTALSWIPNYPLNSGLALNPPNINFANFPATESRASYMTSAERSRLPIDLQTRYVDIIFQPDGQVVTSAASSQNNIPFQVPFYHLWICDRADVFPPTDPGNNKTPDKFLPRLPLPEGVPLGSTHDYVNDTEWMLRNERRLISIQTRSGRITSQTIELFDSTDPSIPYADAQKGIAEAGQ
jgi:prepilin-type N-terminal cleavage/methylation domain-containing protein